MRGLRLLAVLNSALIITYLLGAYLSIAIYSGDQIVIPGLLCVIASSISYAINFRSVNLRALAAIAIISVFSLLVVLYVAVTRDVSATQMIRSSLNLTYSLFFCYGFYISACTKSRMEIKKILFYLWLSLLFGAILERWFGLGILSDAFRNLVFPHNLYVANDRDELLYGGIRPKVFALEPSFVGLWFSTFLVGWLSIRAKTGLSTELITAILVTVIMAFVCRSPTTTFVLPMLICVACLRTERASPLHTDWRPTICGLIVFAVAAATSGLSFLPERNAPQFVMGDSVFARLIAPARVAFTTIQEKPLFGTGPGNQDELFEMALDAYSGRAVGFAGSYADATSARALLTNGFWFHWIFFGLFGGLVMLSLYVALLRTLRAKVYYVLAQTAILWFTIGGYVTIQSWTIAFLFTATTALRERFQHKANTATRPRQSMGQMRGKWG